MKSSTFVSSISGIFQNTLVHRAVPVGQTENKCKKCPDCKNYLAARGSILLIYLFSLCFKLNYMEVVKYDLVEKIDQVRR